MQENLFYSRTTASLDIHERFDIKGSWVNRNFSAPSEGDSATCRLCSEKYVVGTKSEKCRIQAQNVHIPNVVLKDNDLYTKFQLGDQHSYKIGIQLERDSRFLMRRNIMDYSLLAGIHSKQVQIAWSTLDANYQRNEGEWAHLLAFDDEPEDPENVASRAQVLQRQGLNPTTQAQDCCIEASSIVGPHSYYFGIIDILQEWTWDKKVERFFKSFVLRKEADGLSAIEPVAFQDRFMLRIGDIMNITDGSAESGDEMQLEPAAIVHQSTSGMGRDRSQRRSSTARSSWRTASPELVDAAGSLGDRGSISGAARDDSDRGGIGGILRMARAGLGVLRRSVVSESQSRFGSAIIPRASDSATASRTSIVAEAEVRTVSTEDSYFNPPGFGITDV